MKQILVIGAGSIGERHIRCFQKTGRAEVAVCELNNTLRDQICQRYDLKKAFGALDDALSQSFDAAVICTPANLHIPMATRLVAQGMGILIEKPLSTSLEGIDELLSLTASGNSAASVAYVLRQHPALIAVKQAVDSGRFGCPVQVVYTGGQHFPFYRPAYRDIYYTRHETGGGAIQDALTHVMNAAEWLVGPITRLVADADHCVLDGVEVEDTVHVATRHGKIMGSFSLNQHQPPNETLLTVVCDKGAVRYEGHSSRWLTCTEPDSPWTVEDEFSLERDDLFVRQANAFLNQIEGSAPAACRLEEALQTLQVNLAALESVRSGKWVRI